MNRIGERAEEELRGLGYETSLMKPVKFRAIEHCLKAVSKGLLDINAADLEEALTAECLSGEEAKPRSADVDLEQISLLVAEDNPINQKVVSRQLKKMNLQSVTMVSEGQQVLDLLETQAFDVILMDCQMPNLDGLSATRRIRQLESEGHYAQSPPLIIIAMTANAMQGDAEKCIEAGMDAYLSKPVSVVGIKETIEQQLVCRHQAILSLV